MLNDILIGSTYEEIKSFTFNDIKVYSQLTGDVNPIHTDDAFAHAKGFNGRICHGMLVASNISKILAVNFPGEGTIYLNQHLDFKSPAYPNNELKYMLKVVEADNEKRKYFIQTDVLDTNSREIVLTGNALVLVR